MKAYFVEVYKEFEEDGFVSKGFVKEEKAKAYLESISYVCHWGGDHIAQRGFIKVVDLEE